jgi:hypothetical protein
LSAGVASAANASPPTTPSATSAAGSQRRGDRVAVAAMAVAPLADVPDPLDSASNANAKSRADWKRSSGFFSRQCRTTRSSAGGSGRPVVTISGGSSVRMAFIVCTAVSPMNGRAPDSSS